MKQDNPMRNGVWFDSQLNLVMFLIYIYTMCKSLLDCLLWQWHMVRRSIFCGLFDIPKQSYLLWLIWYT